MDDYQLVNLKQKHESLYTTAQEGNFFSMKTLVENGMNINEAFLNGYTPLYIAATCGNLDMVKYLITKCQCYYKKLTGSTSYDNHLQIKNYLDNYVSDDI